MVVATTGMVADAAQALLGKDAVVQHIMGPGVDPHLYKATQGDVSLLQSADLILYSGLHLEGKMTDIFEKLNKTKATYAFAEAIPESDLLYTEDVVVDPHIWFNPKLWSEGILHLARHLSELYPEHADSIQSRCINYQLKIKVADNKIEALMQDIPEENRILVTSHDAFAYFGDRYDVEVNALQGISTAAEFGLYDLNELIEFCIERKLKSIFVESSVNEKSIQAVVDGAEERGYNLKLAPPLYSDAMGAKDTPEGNYLGMILYNAKTIHAALK